MNKLHVEDVLVSVFSGAELTNCANRKISLERIIESGMDRIVTELCYAIRGDKMPEKVTETLLDCAEVWVSDAVQDFVAENNQILKGVA